MNSVSSSTTKDGIDYGVLLVSLDLELYWGVRDKRLLSNYRRNLDGVGAAVSGILGKFAEHGVHGTWATVGMLMCSDKDEALDFAPFVKPDYVDKSLCPYKYLEISSDINDVYHFAPHLVNEIVSTQGQEIATHTYSHFYCLEDGQSEASFSADIEASIRIAKKRGVPTNSIVFPRNQWNHNYLPVLGEMGITSY